MRGGPVYIVKPKYIFKHPFNKYDLANPTNRETQNEELTDYFNYGFNEDTMNIYGKLVKRFIEVLDHHKNLEYFNQPSQLMRLNDEMPMDFGGFCKFHDPWIVDNQTPENFHSGDILLKYFIMTIYANSSRKVEYPLIQFIKSMYKKEGEEGNVQDTFVFDVIEQIDKNLEHKYEETMKKIYEKQNQTKAPIAQKKMKEERKEKDIKQKEKEKEKQKEKEKEKMKEEVKPKKTQKRRSQSQSSSQGSSEDQSSSQTENKKKRRHEREKSDDRSKRRQGKDKGKKKDRSGSRKKKQNKEKDKQKKEKHKTKKVKKEKSYRRSKSKSRDRKKKHHH